MNFWIIHQPQNHRLNKKFFGVFFISSMLLLSGCDQVFSAYAKKSDLSIYAKQSELETSAAELKTLQAEKTLLTSRVFSLEQRIASLESKQLIRDFSQYAYLTPGSDGYSLIKFDLGVLTVSILDIKPYANGSKVLLQFGNPLATKIDGLKAKIEWGQVDADGVPDNATAKNKEFTSQVPLRSGAWTTVTVILEDTPPTKFGFVRIHDVAHTGIELLKK